jgi:hypothetical protein
MDDHELVRKHVEEPFFLFELREADLTGKGIKLAVEIDSENGTRTFEDNVAVASLPEEDEVLVVLFASVSVEDDVTVFLPKVAIEGHEEFTSVVLLGLPDLEFSITTFIRRLEILGSAEGRSDNLSDRRWVFEAKGIEHRANVKLLLDLLCGVDV